MKKIRLLLFVLAVVIPVGASAMPPHPDLLKKWKADGMLETKMTQRTVHDKKMFAKKKSPIPSFPATGTNHIPVILVQFDNQHAANGIPASAPAFPGSMMVILFLGATAFVAFGLKHNRLAKSAALLAIIPGMIIFSPGCGDSGSDKHTTNTAFSSVSTCGYFKNLFDGSGGTALSMKKYYNDMSDGKLDLEFDVYGPYTAEKGHDYYGSNTVEEDYHTPDLVSEAVKMLINDKDASVDFSKYDNDKNGIVDSIIVIHQGPGEEVTGNGNDIWSHQSSIDHVSADSVTFSDYTIQPEYSYKPGDATIGVFCHEFGHLLGLPDLYDVTYTTSGVGAWSLMGDGSWNGEHGGDVPAPLIAWERKYLGWLTFASPSTSGETISVNDINTHFKAVKIPLHTESFDVSSSQYLIVENIVKKTGSWTEYLPGEGLLITKIDDWFIKLYGDFNCLNGSFNNSGTYLLIHGIDVLQAGGVATLWNDSVQKGESTDTFRSGTATSTLSSGSAYPNTNYTRYASYDVMPDTGYTEPSGVTLSDFSACGSVMTFKYTYIAP